MIVRLAIALAASVSMLFGQQTRLLHPPAQTRPYVLRILVEQPRVDQVELRLGRRAASEAQIARAPAGWDLRIRGGVVRLSGDAPETTPLRLELHLATDRLNATIRTTLSAGGRKVFGAKLPVEEVVRGKPLDRLDSVLYVPGVWTSGERIFLKPLDPGRTPPGGRWTIGGLRAREIADGLELEIPEDYAPEDPVNVEYLDPWGDLVVRARTGHGVRTLSASEPHPANPRITGCSTYSFAGSGVCVCGYFPPGSRDRLRIDGREAAVTLAASARVVYFRLPAGARPGVHVISGDTAAGFEASDQVLSTVVAMRSSLDREALVRGQSTTLRIRIDGTPEPLDIALANHTPAVVRLEGGDHQTVTTSGGGDNEVDLRVDSTGTGGFNITMQLAAARCPCADIEPIGDDSGGFFPARALASFAPATPAALAATAQAVAAALGLNVLDATALPNVGTGLAAFQIPDARTVPLVVAALQTDPRVRAAQPDFYYQTNGQAAAQEPYARLSYGARLIGADRLSGALKGRGVEIALLDTGVDADHVELTGRIVEWRDFTGGSYSAEIHGTQVAGIIVADDENGTGIAGVAPEARILSLRTCQAYSRQSVRARCWTSALVKAIDFSLDRESHILNLSVGGKREDLLLTQAIRAVVERGRIVIAAAGNDGPAGAPAYPALLPEVVAVTAVDIERELYAHATRGEYVDLAAPGVEILTPAPGGQYSLASGTSFATAYVTAVAALLLERDRDLGPARMREALEGSAQDLGDSGRDAEYGSGLIDACGAAARALSGEFCNNPPAKK